MHITQQSEKKLVLKEDTKIAGFFMLVVGFVTSLIIIHFTYTLSINDAFMREVAVILVAILLILALVYFFVVYKTTVVTFDKDSGQLIITTSTLFPTRHVTYSLKDIVQIKNKPLTVYNAAWGIQGIIWNKLYGDQIPTVGNPTEGTLNTIAIELQNNKEYVLKSTTWALFFISRNNIDAKKEVTAEKIANFLDVPFSQEEIAKPLVKL